MNTPDIKPTRENWTKFCEEPDITPEEQREWHEMAHAIRNDASGKLLDAVMAATATEQEQVDTLAKLRTEDWSDMVVWSDAYTRLKRAELAWWREYKRQMSNLEGLPLFDSITFTT